MSGHDRDRTGDLYRENRAPFELPVSIDPFDLRVGFGVGSIPGIGAF